MSRETRFWTLLGTIIAVFSAWFTYQQWLLASRPPGQFVQISGETTKENPAGSSPVSSSIIEPKSQVATTNTLNHTSKTVLGREQILAEWSVSENRDHCHPFGFSAVGGRVGVPRRAEFLGGWAVAYDLPNEISAYGIAGTGSPASSDAELQLWPYLKDIEVLGKVSKNGLAGYGVSGRLAFNGNGVGQDGLAYVSIEGESCNYNIWTKLGKAHLELLLENLLRVE